MKRLFDVVLAGCGLIVLAPVLGLAALAVRIESAGPAIFRQVRVGRRFRPFVIYKLRTMYVDRPGRAISVGGDSRITRVGLLLRATKLDELPQLLNVLKGDMSLVGPRPELARYVELFRDDYADILEARPGLTDLASIKYRDEAALLAQAADPEAEYVQRILPDKVRLAREYARRSSLSFDLLLIVRTVLHIAAPRQTGAGD
jgi:lipopolysaccharide/colanic/teichoic acid biosynthesis glycosyltransferase